jgi:hypothetical protein
MNVEAGYHEGRPLHHHESARRQEYDPEMTLSDIFVVEHEDFLKMSPKNVMDVFRFRHILVYNCPFQDEGFELMTFDKFVNVRQLVELHGE